MPGGRLEVEVRNRVGEGQLNEGCGAEWVQKVRCWLAVCFCFVVVVVASLFLITFALVQRVLTGERDSVTGQSPRVRFGHHLTSARVTT